MQLAEKLYIDINGVRQGMFLQGIMCHSWGSLLGVLTVQRAPELYHAYIGIGQVGLICMVGANWPSIQ